MIELWDYQDRIADEASDLLKRHNFVYLALAVRTGKTLTSLFAAKRAGAERVLFLTKKKAIPSIEHDYSTSGLTYDLLVINYESFHKVIDHQYDTLILDEVHTCFVGTTRIDGKEIKDIELGDSLKSFNFDTGKYELKKVVNKFKTSLTSGLVRIKVNGRTIICTENHEIYTRRGWVQARELTTEDEVQVV